MSEQCGRIDKIYTKEGSTAVVHLAKAENAFLNNYDFFLSFLKDSLKYHLTKFIRYSSGRDVLKITE